jgi:hypothetical protein
MGIFCRALGCKMLVNIMTFGIFYSQMVYFMDVWYSLRSFGIVFPCWYVWTKKNLATLLHERTVMKTHVRRQFVQNLELQNVETLFLLHQICIYRHR